MLADRIRYASGVPKLIDAINAAGLASGLVVCLDAGDAASYTSGQSWLDLSGNGFDFFLGASSTAGTDDPTFNGNAGGLSLADYFGFDGGDFLRYDSANETQMDAIHKDSAQWAAFAIVDVPTGMNSFLCGDNAGDGNKVGFDWGIVTGPKQQVSVTFGTGTALSKTADNNMSVAVHMVGVSIDEPTGAGGGFFWIDGAPDQVGSADTFTSTYTTPSTATATHTLEVGSAGNGTLPLTNTTKLYAFALWQGVVISDANFDTLYSLLKGRFGLT